MVHKKWHLLNENLTKERKEETSKFIDMCGGGESISVKRKKKNVFCKPIYFVIISIFDDNGIRLKDTNTKESEQTEWDEHKRQQQKLDGENF